MNSGLMFSRGELDLIDLVSHAIHTSQVIGVTSDVCSHFIWAVLTSHPWPSWDEEEPKMEGKLPQCGREGGKTLLGWQGGVAMLS